MAKGEQWRLRLDEITTDDDVAVTLVFFRLDDRTLELTRVKRRPATRLGWAVQWGTVRVLGTFLTEDPTAVSASVVRFVAEQLALDWSAGVRPARPARP